MASKKFPEDNEEDKQLIMNMALYCSDHTAPTKSSQLYFKWMAVEMEEYYQQGDLERKLDFTVTPFFDRATSNPFKFQLGYVDVIANSLFETWSEFKPVFREILIVQGLEPNRRLLVQKIEETKTMTDQQAAQAQKGQESEKVEDGAKGTVSPKLDGAKGTASPKTAGAKGTTSPKPQTPGEKANKNQVGVDSSPMSNRLDSLGSKDKQETTFGQKINQKRIITPRQ